MTSARLVVNGCSYMENYSNGNGHLDLARSLGITDAVNLAWAGSCNSRIIRTTLRDSYENLHPTLYIIGITFISRYELPLASGSPVPDGKWVSINPQGVSGDLPLDEHFSTKDINDYCDLWDRFTLLGIGDLLVDLQYRLLSMCDSLNHRGHSCVVFNTAEAVVNYVLDQNKFLPLKSQRQIIDGLAWQSVPWQFEQGAGWLSEDKFFDRNHRHVAPGQHKWLNQYLTNYIYKHKILQ